MGTRRETVMAMNPKIEAAVRMFTGHCFLACEYAVFIEALYSGKAVTLLYVALFALLAAITYPNDNGKKMLTREQHRMLLEVILFSFAAFELLMIAPNDGNVLFLLSAVFLALSFASWAKLYEFIYTFDYEVRHD